MSSDVGEGGSASVGRSGSSGFVVRSLGAATKVFDAAWFWWALIITTCLALFFPPSWIAVRAWDFLDSYVAYQHLRPAPSESLFRVGAVAERAASGLPLNNLGLSELNLISIIYSIFPHYLDTALQLTVQVLLLFMSTMAVLMKVLPQGLAYRTLVSGGTSFYIALLPISPVVVGSVIGVDLILYGLLLVRDNASWRQIFLPFVAAPFVAQLPFGPVFYYPAFLLIAMVCFSGNKRRSALLLLLGSCLVSIAIDYRLVLSVLNPVELSHRADWLTARRDSPFSGLFDAATLKLALIEGLQFLRSSQGHYFWNPRGVTTPLLLLGLLGVAILLLRTPRGLRRRRLVTEVGSFSGIGLYVAALVALILVCLGMGILTARVVDFASLLKVPLQVNRAAMVFAPILAAIVIASGLLLIIEAATKLLGQNQDKVRDHVVMTSSLVACGCVLILLVASISASDFVRYKLANMRHAVLGLQKQNLPNATIAMYYEGGLFDQIKVHLGVGWKLEKVISIGIDPMIASVNGFQHLDGYFQSYPLSYKKNFRRIIAPEFEQDMTKKAYFDGWGSRVYIFAERRIGNDLTLNIDGCAAAKLGASLVISRYRIVNAADSLLLPAGEITGSTQGVPSSARLYRIATDKCHGI